MEQEDYKNTEPSWKADTTQPLQPPPAIPVYPPQPESALPPPLKPKNWMVESILVTIIPTIFCCNVFALLGIIAIVQAAKVDRLFYNGEYAASAYAARKARTWVFITLGIAAAGIILNIILWFTGFTSTFMEHYMQSIESLSSGGESVY